MGIEFDDIKPFEIEGMPDDSVEVSDELDHVVAASRDEFIAETLAWCADLFSAARVRFVRPLERHGWVVYTRQKESIVTHHADYAEIAMAYTVGLGRQPLMVKRPRITRFDGSGLRPIALTSYLGIPLVCQDRLVGVIEFAGEVRPDVEAALYAALPRLANVGERLLFDPQLTLRRTIAPDAWCSLDSAIWAMHEVVIMPEEMAFLGAIDGPTTVAEAGEAAGLTPERTLEVAQSLAERGLLSIET